MTIILDGNILSNRLIKELYQEIEKFRKENNIERPPGLATILVGDDKASKLYVKMKQKKCEELGILNFHIELPSDSKKDDVIGVINKLNKNPNIDGILLQLPLPDNLKQFTGDIISNIIPEKDVDGFHPINIGKILLGDEKFAPCTPKGIIKILEEYKIPIESQYVVIVNHSTVIGKPLSLMFLNRDATVTVCHIKTKNIENYLKEADIICVGIGKYKFLTSNKVRKGVVIVDAGISRDPSGNLCGDADFNNLIDIASAITPVPGGVGPMTIAMLMENTFLAYKNRINNN